MRKRGEKGQVVLVVVIAIALVLIGGIGLAIDSSQLYGQRQMAQVAADAAALGAIMSIFDKTNTGGNAFGSAAFTCTTSTDARTPCLYARQNGFGKTSDDAVKVDFPASVTGVALSGDYPVNVVHVLITRTVSNWFIKLVGGPATTAVKAAATAAIVDVVSPVPILVTHPTLDNSFSIGGNTSIKICGGPSRSIQVNSSGTVPSAGAAVSGGGSTVVDLSHAGPNDPGDCSGSGSEGADFGAFGGPATYPGTIQLGTNGKYIQPSSPIQDPLASLTAPAPPSNHAPNTTVLNGVDGCPAASCTLYHPGNYPSGINVKNETAIFLPGLYYMSRGGFANAANGDMHMATGLAVLNDPVTGWSAGHMMVYNTGNSTGDIFDVGANSGANLAGSPLGSCPACNPGYWDYKGVLFFQDRSSTISHTGSKSHQLGGGGNITLQGTLYMVNSSPTASTYQNLRMRGHAGNTTLIIGEIIVNTLDDSGSPNITMQLDPTARLHIAQVALVK
jgi:hypothetical protein